MKRWSEEELELLKQLYTTLNMPDMLIVLPGRTETAIRNKVNELRRRKLMRGK